MLNADSALLRSDERDKWCLRRWNLLRIWLVARQTQYMPTAQPKTVYAQYRLRTFHVLRVTEEACDVSSGSEGSTVRFAKLFPSPRVERVSPGHLVAVATGPTGSEAVVWRWYDAVVLGLEDDGSVRLWEPAHGEVLAQRRASFNHHYLGTRAYASSGLPGADWWVAGSANVDPRNADVELEEVDALYTENSLWPEVFA
jgi:hypothetical protein